MIRLMTAKDYPQVYRLWKSIHGLGIRSIDDSQENITRFLKRNPTTSFVAEENNRIVGSLLCGHDGRRACFYHVCVEEAYRKQGLGTQMAQAAIEALKVEGINKVNLMAFVTNEVGNQFWKQKGWKYRDDINIYEMDLNKDNVTIFNE